MSGGATAASGASGTLLLSPRSNGGVPCAWNRTLARRGLQWLILVLAGAALAAGPAVAWAQPLAAFRDGDELFNRGQFQAAFDAYVAAYRSGQAAGDKLAMAEAMNDIAAIHIERNDYARFKSAVDQAQSLKRAHAEDHRDLVPIAEPGAAGNILGNGGFEAGLFYPWGLGHYEREEGRFKFGIWWNSKNARAYMKIDTAVTHSGDRALRITNFSPAAPHVFTTTSQRIEGLEPNTVVRVSMFVKAKDLAPGAVTFTVDAGWTKRLPSLPPGTYDWRPYSATVNIGHNAYIDFRILHQNVGTVWIDDLVIEKLAGGETSDPLQRAESLFDLARYAQALAVIAKIERDYPEASGLRLAARRLAGRIQMTQGNYEEALASFDWVLDRGRPRVHRDLGDLYAELGEHLKAVVHYEKALDAVRGDQSSESLVLNRLGAARMALSRTLKAGPEADALVADAKTAMERSLAIVRHIGDQHGEVETLLTLGALRQERGDYGGAVDLYARALKTVSRLSDRKLLSDALLRLAEANLLTGEAAEAGRLAEEARAIKAEIGDGLGAVQALGLLGRALLAAGDRHGARLRFKAAIDRLTTLYGSLATAPKETRQAFLAQFQDLYRTYIDLLFDLYNQDRRPETQKAAFELSEQVRSRVFSEMVAESRAASALEAQTKDPAFARLLAREREILVRLQALHASLGDARATPDGAADGARTAALNEEVRLAERDYAELLQELERSYPRYFELKRPKPLALAEVQRLLGDDEAVLSYAVTASATGLWVLTRRDVSFTVLPWGQRELAGATVPFSNSFAEIVRRLGALYRPSREEVAALFALFDPAAAYRLYRALVQPAARALEGKRIVYLAPDDVLYKLPFDALLSAPLAPRPGRGEAVIGAELAAARFLARELNFVYLPSLSVLRTLRTGSRRAATHAKTFLAFADPIFDERGDPGSATAAVRGIRMQRLRAIGSIRGGRLSPLPNTREEALHIAEALGTEPAGAVFLGREASEYNVKHLPLADYRYILFATHGLLAGEFGPGVQPALALSFVGDPENDGLLEMGEILGLDLSADLVALSACNTAGGSGADDRGEGFAGLTRSFMYAGARALLVTQWSVETTSAERLMRQVFRGALAASISQSLVEAKRAFLERPSALALTREISVSTAHPFFWAPFILVGEGR